MQIPEPHIQAILIKRYKRFLADVRLPDDSTMTVHCPNTGSMRGCSAPGSPVIISRSANPGRKYPWTLEMVHQDETWIGVNTALTNRIVREAMENGTIDAFGLISAIRREVRVRDSRLDFLLETESGPVYVEVKNCSLVEGGTALFPDAVTARGTRHLHALDELRRQGFGAALIFCIQRNDAVSFAPARAIDPVYAETMEALRTKGLTVLACRADVWPDQVRITGTVPIQAAPRIPTGG